MVKLKISDYTLSPGLRYSTHSDFSAEFFTPKILKCLSISIINKWKFHLDMDGTVGYSYSFWDEISRQLINKYSKVDILNHLELISNEEPYLIEEFIDQLNKYDKERFSKED